MGTVDRFNEALAASPIRSKVLSLLFRGIPVIGIALLTLGTPQPARAATIQVTDRASGQLTLISIEGKLEFGDEKKFLEKVADVQKGVVVLASDGGNLYSALEIGRVIRQRGFHTAVTDRRRCASACALAWLAGRSRLMADNAQVGFHRAYRAERGEMRESGSFNALTGAYLNSLGLSEDAILYVMRAPPEAMTWLTFADAAATGIDVQRHEGSIATAFQPPTASARAKPPAATAASTTPSAVPRVEANLIVPRGELAQPPVLVLRPRSLTADSAGEKPAAPFSRFPDLVRKRTEPPVPLLIPAL